MKFKQSKLRLSLFALGFLGILSMLTMDISLPPEAEAVLSDQFSPMQIKLLTLVNPTILLIITVTVGSLLYEKVNLRVPIIEHLIGDKQDVNYLDILKFGIVGGVIAGVLLSITALLFNPVLPEEFLELSYKVKPSLAARFLYGGFTEELMMRFGLMTFIVWIFSKLFRGTKPIVYWIGILFAAIIFGLGHFPIAFQALGNPSSLLLSYILISNSIGGIIFGWLYYKKGLESAFVGHIFTHVILVIAEPMIYSF